MGSAHQHGQVRFSYRARSDMGRVRQNNEDALIEAPEIGLLGVCDGLGGHAAGEVASAIASSAISEVLKDPGQTPEKTLEKAIRQANESIFQRQAGRPEYQGMGTTLSGLWLGPNNSSAVWVAHVGDSRIYRQRDGKLAQVTEDHSPVFRLYKEGILTKDQMRSHPQKNLLERSLGCMPKVKPDLFPIDLDDQDLILICTDGLTDVLGDKEIESLIAGHSMDEAVEGLVAAANREGGPDNITLILIQILLPQE